MEEKGGVCQSVDLAGVHICTDISSALVCFTL